jgi:hypothetical protein
LGFHMQRALSLITSDVFPFLSTLH